ncbi:MAG: hypothetical protein LQ343_006835 [Gyalolechia ehrenbergii]|nr:MAG: hypothetical protein LQ343_006835 [Gyalolechia ehrenbergii]
MHPESASTTTPTTAKATICLNELPPELKTMIFEACDYPTFRALRCVNSVFNIAGSAAKKQAILISTEHSRPYALPNDTYICHACERFKNTYHFADDEIGGEKVHGGNRAASRICLRCGLAKGIYRRLRKVTHQGANEFVCWDCKEFCGIYKRDLACAPSFRFETESPSPTTKAEAIERREYADWHRLRLLRGKSMNQS